MGVVRCGTSAPLLIKRKQNDMANGGTGGAGAGYNIPISLSAASTFSVPQTQSAPSYVIFGDLSGGIGPLTTSPTNINPATATSAAAQGDALASTEDSGVDLMPKAGSGFAGLSVNTYLIIGVIVLGGMFVAIQLAKR